MSIVTATILNQMGGTRMFAVMLGVKKILLLQDSKGRQNGIRFSFKNPDKELPNQVDVMYNPGTDLYDLTFRKVLRSGWVQHSMDVPDVYAEDLIRICQDYTNMTMVIPTIVGLNDNESESCGFSADE